MDVVKVEVEEEEEVEVEVDLVMAAVNFLRGPSSSIPTFTHFNKSF